MRMLSQGLVAPTQRTIPDFDLRRPLTVDEAVAAGAGRPSVYAQGCTDLFAQFREGLRCTTLVSLDKVTGLRDIGFDGGTLRIGAGAIHHEGARHPAVVSRTPGPRGRLAADRHPPHPAARHDRRQHHGAPPPVRDVDHVRLAGG